MTLPAEQRATLHHACETVVPALEPQAGDHKGLFRASATSQGILPVIDEIVNSLPRSQVRDLGLLLSLLERPLFVFWLCGRYRRFSALSQSERERALLHLARNRFGLLRKGFQAIKRLSCFAFYAVQPSDDASVSEGIGYTPSSRPAARAARLRVTEQLTDEVACDVCIVGSGAGGGVLAAELAAAGRRVLVLETAVPLQAADFQQAELESMKSLYLQEGRLSTQDLSVMIVAGSALGGGTAINWQTSLRTPDDVREEWATRSGCTFFREASFTAALDAVCERLSVGTAESRINASNDVLRRGCEALGYHWSKIPRNARGCDYDQCGYCTFGCRVGGKQSSTVTFLQDAVATGNATIVGNCTVERIEQESGRATGVTAQLAGRPIRVRAPIVVVAAGAIESPALLLRSGISLPALGRHLHLHPASCVTGVFQHDVRAWLGAPQSVLCDEFSHLDGGYGFRLEMAPAHPGLFALALPWHSARSHRELMQSFACAAPIVVLTRDHTGGRVSVTRNRRTRVDYQPGLRELNYLKRGIAEASRVLAAAGAEHVVTMNSQPQQWRAGEDIDGFARRVVRMPLDRNWSTLLTAHQLGTCRMGRSADEAVCDENGEVFGVRGLYIGDTSAFPGSCGVNPMITVMALAYHTAGRIADRVKGSRIADRGSRITDNG